MSSLPLSAPITIKEWRKRFLFGLVEVDYLIEDRRPDLLVGEYWGKYKHCITITTPFNRCAWVLHTAYDYNSNPYI